MPDLIRGEIVPLVVVFLVGFAIIAGFSAFLIKALY